MKKNASAAHVARMESYCATCDAPLTVTYFSQIHTLRIHHGSPFCQAAYSLLCNQSYAECEGDRDAAYLAASAEFLVGWDVLGFLVSKAEDLEEI
jgi:hypothetical protein